MHTLTSILYLPPSLYCMGCGQSPLVSAELPESIYYFKEAMEAVHQFCVFVPQHGLVKGSWATA